MQNYGYPYYYQPQAYSPVAVQAQQTGTGSQNLIWVQGEAGAKSYLVAPNTTVPLWDSETQTIYLKSADASGMPSMKVLDYTVRDMLPPKVIQPTVDYVTKDEFDKLRAEVQKMMEDRHESVV